MSGITWEAGTVKWATHPFYRQAIRNVINQNVYIFTRDKWLLLDASLWYKFKPLKSDPNEKF